MNNNINLLDNGLQNNIMMMYREYLKEYDEVTARKLVAKKVFAMLQQFDKNGILIDGIENAVSIRKTMYDLTVDENEKHRLYTEIESLSDTLNIIRRSNS